MYHAYKYYNGRTRLCKKNQTPSFSAMSKSSDDQIRALLKSLNGDVSAVTEHLVMSSAPGARTALEAELDESDRPASAARTSLETDDVGDAPEGEVSVETMGILRALAETPLGRPGLINVMMNLDPASLNSLCRTSRDFEHICADPTFRVPYEQKWYVNVRFAGLTGAAHNVRLMKTRTAGDAKRALAQASGSPYNYINIIFNGTLPTAQSSLDGMIKAATAAGRSVTPLVMPFTLRLGGRPYDYTSTSRHYMPDGTNFDVSRD